MEILSEFFDPIPIAAMVAAVFAIVFILAVTLIFRMPKGFAEKEQVRMELRFRLADEKAAAELAEKKDKEAEAEKEKPAETDNEKPAEAAEAPKDAPAATPHNS